LTIIYELNQIPGHSYVKIVEPNERSITQR